MLSISIETPDFEFSHFISLRDEECHRGDCLESEFIPMASPHPLSQTLTCLSPPIEFEINLSHHLSFFFFPIFLAVWQNNVGFIPKNSVNWCSVHTVPCNCSRKKIDCASPRLISESDNVLFLSGNLLFLGRNRNQMDEAMLGQDIRTE
jgi:hypothetical protein